MKLEPEIRRTIDGRIQYFYQVKVCAYPPEGPKELWGFIAADIEGNYVVASDAKGHRQLYKREYNYEIRRDKDLERICFWQVLKYEGSYK